MIDGLKRNGVQIGGIVACGAVCVSAGPFLLSGQGSVGPTMFQAQSPAMAVVAVVLMLGVSALLAAVVSRVINTAVGLFCFGCGLFVLTLRLGTVLDLAIEDGSLTLVAVETLLVGALVAGAVLLVFRLGGPLSDIKPRESDEADWSVPAIISRAAPLLMIPVVWVIGRSPMAGQAFGAVVAGGLVVGLVGRLGRPSVQPTMLYVLPMVAGALGHLIGRALSGPSLEAALVGHTLHPLNTPMPLTYAAGTLVGVSMGLGWARSFLHYDEEGEAEAAPAG